MNVAVIGADAESVHAIKNAKKLGHRVIAVDKDPEAEGARIADVRYQIDISHESEVIEALSGESPDMVLTTPIGRNLATIGAVNDAFGLPGITREQAVLCSDKYAFHNRLRNVGLREGHCYLVNSGTPIYPEDIRYPAVFKPRFGSHGRSVHYLKSPEELAGLLEYIWMTERDGAGKKPAPDMKAGEFAASVKQVMEDRLRLVSEEDDPNDDYILEEALPGVEYAVDGFVEGCNFEIILIRRKELTAPPARQALSYTGLMHGDDTRAQTAIKTYMSRLCEVIGFRECMLHADVCVHGQTVNAIEVSASPAGRHVYDEFIPMATGVDPTEQFLRYMAGSSHYFEPLNMKRLMLRYFDMEHCFIHGIPEREDIVSALPEGVRLRAWDCRMKLLDYMGGINDEKSLLDRGYYIIEADSDRLLREAAGVIMKSFELK